MNNIKKSYFGIDIMDSMKFYEGYHDPNKRWNGWAIPYFTKEVADMLSKEFSNGKDYKIKYNKKKDTYICYHYLDGELYDKYFFDNIIIDIDNKKITCYGNGAGYYTWDSFTFDEKEKILNEIKAKEETKDLHHNL